MLTLRAREVFVLRGALLKKEYVNLIAPPHGLVCTVWGDGLADTDQNAQARFARWSCDEVSRASCLAVCK